MASNEAARTAWYEPGPFTFSDNMVTPCGSYYVTTVASETSSYWYNQNSYNAKCQYCGYYGIHECTNDRLRIKRLEDLVNKLQITLDMLLNPTHNVQDEEVCGHHEGRSTDTCADTGGTASKTGTDLVPRPRFGWPQS